MAILWLPQTRCTYISKSVTDEIRILPGKKRKVTTSGTKCAKRF